MASFENNHMTLIVLPLTPGADPLLESTPIMSYAKSFANISLSFPSPAGLCPIGTPHLPFKLYALKPKHWVDTVDVALD
nr:hypothetical protein I308_02689 [Cryptococcus tetragattii IND107]